jgi:serine/threonine-protein kinase
LSYHPAASTSAPARLGRYELLGQLATGGMAEIHLARLAGEGGFEKLVVVKRLLPELVGSRAFVAMFLDEGKLVARLDHPNICEVHELGRDGGEYFLVMPYLTGVPVSALIARPRDPDLASASLRDAARPGEAWPCGRRAQLRVAAGVIVQACAGLHHAHELTGPDGEPLGLVHRDVSPSNLFATTSGVVKVLDFGIAKVRGAAETEVGTVKGKSEYMAPEQVLGEPVDRRCDVFALGIVLFELATHQRLFKRASEYLAARAILEEPIPRADAVDPAVPAALADVIARALARGRDDRFADARALARALEGAMAADGGVARAEEIAAALSSDHGEQLSAQRTQQVKIVEAVRTGAGTAAVAGPAGTAAAVGPAGADTQLQTAPVHRVRARRRAWFAAAGLLAACGGVIAVVAALRGDPVSVRPTQDRPTSADLATGDRTPDNRTTEDRTPDNRTTEDRTTEDRTTENRTPENRTPDNRTPDNRTPENRTPENRTTGNRTATPTWGRFSIDSTPYATIYVDGHKLGVTPILQHRLTAGHHQVRAVLGDGREQRVSLDVPAHGVASPVVLRW